MTDPFTPPPDHPLDDTTRARLRERVLAGTEEQTRSRGWLLPVAAAAAVAVVAGGTALALSGDGGREVAPAGPGVPTPEPTSAGPTSAPTAAEEPTVPPEEEPLETPTDPGQMPNPPTAAERCEPELEYVLKGAEERVSIGDDLGSTVFYTRGDRYTLCAVNGDTVTVHHAKPLAGGGDYSPYEISTDFLSRRATVFVAGGPVPAGSPDFSVTYRFADGAEVSSAVAGGGPDDLWWVVVHRSDDGDAVFNGPVTVEVTGGPDDGTYELDVTDRCAQANHGC